MTKRQVTVNCLGSFEVSVGNGLPIAIRSERSRALLVCLAVEKDAWTRERLSFLLWADGRGHRPRSNLRQQLLALRHDLATTVAADWSHGDRIKLPSKIGTDIEVFRDAIQRGDHLTAVRIYRGDLFADARLKNSVFREWLLKWQYELRSDAFRSLLFLLRSSTIKADKRKFVAQRLVTLDPACEEAHQALIHLHLDQGDLALAVEQYRLLSEALKSCGREPSSQSSAAIAGAVGSSSSKPQPLGNDVPSAAWIAEINRQHDVAAPPNPRLMAPVRSKPSIATLPFVDLSPSRLRNDAVADGLTEEVAMALTRVPGLFVTARQSVMVYKRSSLDIRRITAELGIRYALGACPSNPKLARLVEGNSGMRLLSKPRWNN